MQHYHMFSFETVSAEIEHSNVVLPLGTRDSANYALPCSYYD